MKDIVLGLHKDLWHDTGAAVIATNPFGERVVAHINQERLDRKKSSRGFPKDATDVCFRELGLTGPRAADLVVLDFMVDPNNWQLDYRNYRCETDTFLADIDPGRIQMVRHHLCHAAASFFTSPFSEAAVLVVDGRGSHLHGIASGPETQSLWIGSGNKLTLVEESDKTGIGALYESVTKYLGFGFLEAGKTMGLAPFGASRQGPVLNFDGRLCGIHTDYEQLCDVEEADLTMSRPVILDQASRERCAYDVQAECEKAMLHLASHAYKTTGMDSLCLGGGVALNGVANAAIANRRIFKNIFINPACSDSGISLGAALWGYHNQLGAPRVLEPLSAYTGPLYSKDHILQVAKGASLRIIDDGLNEAIRMLSSDKVVALFQGRSEMGPRALGNRSILMSPKGTYNRDHLNNVVKRREPFRPFAPCVPLECASHYFELDAPSPYMLHVVSVRTEWRSALSATTHIDGTARVQTVTQHENSFLYSLLKAYGEVSGVPVLLNTSFNVAGEPLVETPEDAVRCFMNAEIDGLLIEGILLIR